MSCVKHVEINSANLWCIKRASILLVSHLTSWCRQIAVLHADIRTNQDHLEPHRLVTDTESVNWSLQKSQVKVQADQNSPPVHVYMKYVQL